MWIRRTIKSAKEKLKSVIDIQEHASQIIELDSLLEKLIELDKDMGKIVELIFFAGISIKDTDHMPNTSTNTANKDRNRLLLWLIL